MTGHVDGNISLETLLSLNYLFQLDEMSNEKFILALNAGTLSGLVVN